MEAASTRPGTAIGPIVHEHSRVTDEGRRWRVRTSHGHPLAWSPREPRLPSSRDPQSIAVGRDGHAAVPVGPEDPGRGVLEPGDGRSSGVAVAVPGADREGGDRRANGRQERRGRGRPAPVVGHLERVGVAQSACEEDGVDLLLRVAHEQEPASPDRELEHDGQVIDALAVLRRGGRHAPGVRPQHPEVPVVDGEPVAAGQPPARLVVPVEQAGEGDVAGTRTRHPGLEEAPDAVSADQSDQPSRVILVGMGEHDHVEAPVPGGQPGVQENAQAVGIRPAVDQDPASRRALDEDRVALSDVEEGDPRPAIGTSRDDATADENEGRDEREKRGCMARACHRSSVLVLGPRSGPRRALDRSRPGPPPRSGRGEHE